MYSLKIIKTAKYKIKFRMQYVQNGLEWWIGNKIAPKEAWIFWQHVCRDKDDYETAGTLLARK